MWNKILEKLSGRGVAAALFAANFLIIFAGWAWVYARLRNLGMPIILHFSVNSGIDRIGNIRDIHEIAILGLLIVTVNGAVGLALESRNAFLGKLLTAMTCVMAGLIFILFVAIISVN